MQSEKWLVVPGFSAYEINESLEIRHRVFRKIKKCWMSDGYLRLNMDRGKKKHKPYLHQVVAWTFVPNPENKPEIHHIDCDPLNNHWSNLQWVTRKEHKELSKRNGQIAHKLKPADVVYVRDIYSADKEQELATKYEVSKLTIYLIATGQVRGDIKGGKIHDRKGFSKKVINIKTGEIFKSVEEVAVKMGINFRKLRRGLSGERYNDTHFRYLGEEDVVKIRPKKVKIISFISHSFGVIIPRKERVKSTNPKALWKSVVQLDMDGNEVTIYESIREAARAMKTKDHKTLQKLLNGKRGKTFKGFLWKYAVTKG